MFELFGLWNLRLIGYGWLWKRHEQQPTMDEVFGNAGLLLPIGFIALAIWAIIGLAVMVWLDSDTAALTNNALR